MKLFTNLDHEVISLYLYTLVMPLLLHGILLDYISKYNLPTLFDGLIKGTSPTGVHSSFGFDICSWYVERRPLPSDSDMFWISPGHDATFGHLLGHLGSGDIESVLRGTGSVSGLEVKSLVIFNLNFGVLSYCQSQHFHIDYSEDLTCNVWTVVIPLILVNNSNPELLMESSHTKKIVSIKYDFENIVIFGPSTIHSTAPVAYCDEAYRVCLFVSVAHITKGNINMLLEDITSLYPYKDDKALLLRWSCNRPHWKHCRTVICTNIPAVSGDLIFGDRWCKMFGILQSLTNSTDGNAVPPDHPSSSISFRQWVSEQRHYYSLKHCSSDTVLCQRRKLARLMTHAREAKLKSIWFLFSCPYDCGIGHHWWMPNFNKLKSFYEQHGHCNVIPSHDVPKSLVVWVHSQCRALRCKNSLNNVQLLWRNHLKTINFMWQVYSI
jgi:hypothetical protein